MNAPARLELPLDGGVPSTPPRSCHPAVQGEAFFHPDYVRLFGTLSPDQVIQPLPVPDPKAGHPGASPPLFNCDPNDGGEAPFLNNTQGEGMAYWSRALGDVAALRAQHMARGHTPETDAAHGYLFFWLGTQDFARQAFKARDLGRRRKHLISAAAMLLALIDCEDFTSLQGTTDER